MASRSRRNVGKPGDAHIIRPMMPYDVAAAQRVHRLAFGTFFGARDPRRFRPESQAVVTRYRTDRAGCIVAGAGMNGRRILGSALMMEWGSAAIVGPITVHPDFWGKGVARSLMSMAAIMIGVRGFKHAALHTHPESPTHLRLYQQFDFWPGALTAILAKSTASPSGGEGERLSRLSPGARRNAIAGCERVADAVFKGLDLTREIDGLAKQKLGDTLILRAGRIVRGFAVCHYGRGSEARPDALYVKFAAVRPGDASGFEALVAAIEHLAAAAGTTTIGLGVNTARLAAYRMLLARGYRCERYGVTMHYPAGPGWDLPDRFVIDDLR